MVGPWLFGQERDTTIIRLVDGAAGFGDPTKPQELIRGHWRADGAKMSADVFDRTLVNFTVDCVKTPTIVPLARSFGHAMIHTTLPALPARSPISLQ